MTEWTVYMVECADRTLYTGITTDIQRRMAEHNSRNSRTRYTRARQPVNLVYQESAANQAAASRREYQIKQLPSTHKRQLLDSNNPDRLQSTF